MKSVAIFSFQMKIQLEREQEQGRISPWHPLLVSHLIHLVAPFIFVSCTHQVNSDWKAERLDVVVATVAFGMGLDRPSVYCMIACVLCLLAVPNNLWEGKISCAY